MYSEPCASALLLLKKPEPEAALPLPLGSSGSGALLSVSSADTGILSPAAASLVRSLTAAAREVLCDAVEFEIECE